MSSSRYWPIPSDMIHAIVRVLVLGALLSGTAIAQSPAQKPAREPNPSAKGPTSPTSRTLVPLLRTDAPYTIPSLGLSVYMPEDSLVDLSRVEGGRTTVLITPQGDTRSWVFQIHNSISTDKSLTISEALDNIVSQRQQFRTTKDTRGRTVSAVRAFDRQDDLIIGQHPVQRVYLDVPLDTDVPVTGYTIFETGPGQFLLFQMDCPVGSFPAVRELYETFVASSQFRDPEELGADRAAALLAGESLRTRFNHEDIDAVLDAEPIFYRLYRPAPTGAPSDAEEIGYQRFQIRRGSASELEGRRKSANDEPDAAPDGLIVRIDARALALGAVVDSVSQFYLSNDRSQELWSITMAVRKDQEIEQWVETGIRRGDRLTVKTTRSGSEPTTAEWSPLPKGYVTRVESYTLPRLAVRGGLSGIFGYYMYESNLGKMTLRRETIAQEKEGVWIISTQPSENSASIVSELDSSGRLLRRIMPDGQIMEPIDPVRLRKLWSDKKLPLD